MSVTKPVKWLIRAPKSQKQPKSQVKIKSQISREYRKQVGTELGQAQPSWSLAWCWSKFAIIGLRIDPKAYMGPTQIG